MLKEMKIIEITVPELAGKVLEMFQGGYRLVQIHALRLDPAANPEGNVQLNYTFDKEYAPINLRLVVSTETELPSVSQVYPPAFLYENELHDLFGLQIKNITIDYQGKLYHTAIPTPFNPKEQSAGEVGQNG